MKMVRLTGNDNAPPQNEDPLDLDPSFAARFQRFLRNGVLALFPLTVLAFGTVEYWSIALFGVIIVILFLCWGLGCAFFRRPVLFLPALLLPLLLAILYAIAQVISSVDAQGRYWALSMDPEATWLVIEVLSLLFLAGLLFANLFQTRHRLLLFRNVLIAFGLIYSIFAIINHFTWNGRYFWLIEPTVISSHPFGSFVNHNHFAGFVEMIAPLPLALVITRTVRGELALINGFASAIMGIATILSLSRGGMISLISGLLFTVILGLRPTNALRGNAKQGRLILARFLISGAMLVILAIGVLWVGGDAVIERLNPVPAGNQPDHSGPIQPDSVEAGSSLYQSRGFIWEDTIRMIRDNWLVGVGLGAYQTAYPIYSLRDRFYLVGQSHNDYLQIIADGGLPLASIAALFLLLLVYAGSRAVNHPDPSLASLAVGCAGGTFALLVHSLFDFNFQIISNSLLFLALSLIIWRVGYLTINRRVGSGLIQQSKQVNGDPLTTTEMEVWS
ncbi:MAG: O-antigen ligase domain-containing protein [Acidobacteria bacterium]|nr:O-antigen ligase domain-containing protein [Acidobacteriota bacterium]